MQHLIWYIHPTRAPFLQSHCPRCGQSLYENSGCFRINANGPRLDVWLIYRCVHCKKSWNLDVLSRIPAKSVQLPLYRRFQENDADLALAYGCDPGFLRRNHAAVEPDSLLYVLDGSLPENRSGLAITIVPDYPLEVPIVHILSEGLHLSRSEIKRLYESGRLRSDLSPLKKMLTQPFSCEIDGQPE